MKLFVCSYGMWHVAVIAKSEKAALAIAWEAYDASDAEAAADYEWCVDGADRDSGGRYAVLGWL